MARMAGLGGRIRLLYDMRGPFSDAPVAADSWARGGFLDRAMRRAAVASLMRADGLVAVTEEAWKALPSARARDLPRRGQGAALRLARLPKDPDTSRRCRRAVEERLRVERGVEAYHDLYREHVG